MIRKPLLLAACVCILCCLLIAGLWPFFPPKNEVSWLGREDGLRFGEHATILSSSGLNPGGTDRDCAVEVWLQPARTIDSNTILDIYTPGTPFRFRMRQSRDDLVILRNYGNGQDYTKAPKLYVDHVFQQNRAVLIAVSANTQNTSIYINGQLAKSSPQFGFSTQDLRGRLIVGAAPVTDDHWSGKLLGLGVYETTLDSEQALLHYRAWIDRSLPTLARGALALYTFSEKTGAVIYSQVNSGPILEIPVHFMVVGQAFLMPPWKEFSPGWSYYKDLLVNVAGFIPLGFVVYAYLARTGHNRQTALKTILIGAATSLTIEVLQAYIPTRQSGMTDLITNTLGTALGSMLFQCMPLQTLIVRCSFHKLRREVTQESAA